MLVAKKERFDYNDLPQVINEKPRVKRVRKVRTATKSSYFAVALIFLALAFVLTARHAQIDTVGYELIALKKQQQALVMENQVLQSRLDQLKSLENIEYIATYKLGMQKPENAEGVQFVPVEYSKARSEDKTRTTWGDDVKKGSKPQQKKNSIVQALASIINS